MQYTGALAFQAAGAHSCHEFLRICQISPQGLQIARLLSQFADGQRPIIGHGQERLEAGCTAAAKAAQHELDTDRDIPDFLRLADRRRPPRWA